MYKSASEAQQKRSLRDFAAALLRVLLLSGALFAVPGCQSVAPGVKIGLVAPFEGRHRNVGYDVIYSARLAVREINEAGGIDGTRVALVALDDTGNPEYAEATARSLVIDPAVVAVVGHWLPETSQAAHPIYTRQKLPFLLGGVEPFAATDPEHLPADFVNSYATVTPFDETPGPYAAPAYDAFQLLFQAFAIAQEKNGVIDRSSVQAALDDLK